MLESYPVDTPCVKSGNYCRIEDNNVFKCGTNEVQLANHYTKMKLQIEKSWVMHSSILYHRMDFIDNKIDCDHPNNLERNCVEFKQFLKIQSVSYISLKSERKKFFQKLILIIFANYQ